LFDAVSSNTEKRVPLPASQSSKPRSTPRSRSLATGGPSGTPQPLNTACARGGPRRDGMVSNASLYDTDFFAWTEEQAAALRDAARLGANIPLDWENLAEEIESLGLSVRRELRSRIGVIMEHLLKLEHSGARDPRAGWMDTVERERLEVERLLDENPSLRPRLGDVIAKEASHACRLAARSLARHGEASAAAVAQLGAAPYTEEQVLGDWWPDGELQA